AFRQPAPRFGTQSPRFNTRSPRFGHTVAELVEATCLTVCPFDRLRDRASAHSRRASTHGR
ncbi:MAG: hypothetical protein LBS86_01470, partial [Treponema sp.]|nr:hypothetical protein [Treponema sp.]